MDDLLVVGIGASAGGVKSLNEFFTHVTPDGGVTYVVILPASLDQERRIAAALQASSAIPVRQVTARVRLQPDCVYVVSPNQRLAMGDGFLDVTPITRTDERRLPVDVFFRTLADVRGSHAVGVVLSGTGSDGSSGLQRIKERGGLCLVQDPDEAEHDDMPRHAIATGFADGVLRLGDIPARIAAYRRALVEVTGSDDENIEEKLRKNEEHFRLVLDSITEHAIVTLDADGTIVNWNIGAEHLFGFTRDEAIGQSTALIFTPEDRAREAHVEEMRVARVSGRAADERWHVRKDGSRVFVSGVLSPIGRERVTGYVKVARDLTERKRQEDALQRANDQLESRVAERTHELAMQLAERRRAEARVRKLLGRLITVQEDERRRIARDLHDDLGQKMTALHLKLDALCRATAGLGKAHEEAREAQAFVQQLDRDLDFFTWELRPAALYDLGLPQALRDFVQNWTKDYAIVSEFEAIGVADERWRPDIEIHLYRIAQEALNNVYKHARATKVDVVLQRRSGQLVLSIEDNGVGLDPAMMTPNSHGRGMGLIGMRERAALMGGVLEIERSASGGTTIIVRAPAVARDEPLPGDDDDAA